MWCKHCNFESSLHVPLILKVPGKTAGERKSAIVEFIDIYPSLAELAGLPLPKHLEGESLVPLLNNQPRQKNYAIAKYGSGVTLIKDNAFYTEWLDDSLQTQARMLFNHTDDPLELYNLAEEESQQHKVEQYSVKLRQSWGNRFLENPNESVSH